MRRMLQIQSRLAWPDKNMPMISSCGFSGPGCNFGLLSQLLMKLEGDRDCGHGDECAEAEEDGGAGSCTRSNLTVRLFFSFFGGN